MTFNSSVELHERIKRIRLLRGWDQADVSEKSGINKSIVSQLETGRLVPTREQMRNLAEAFGYSEQFLTTDLDLGPTSRPWLRAYADASKREADARMASASIAAEYIHRLRLQTRDDLIPEFLGNPDDDEAIEEAATELRQIADIDSDAVVPNAIRAAERLGCVVLPLESELGKHLGMSVRSNRLPILYVARDGVPGDRQRFTVCHELGHLMLHRDAPPPRDADEAARMEKQANRFAAAFLGPGDPLVATLEQLGGKVTLRSLMEVKAIWGIAIKGLVGRYQSLGIIDADQARSLYKQISARKWTKSEPVEVPIETAQWFTGSLQRSSGIENIHGACTVLATNIGGNAADLQTFVDWEQRENAPIVRLADRRNRKTG